MNWTIVYVDSKHIIRATVSGDLTAEGFKALEAELLEEAKRRKVNRCLCDCRAASSNLNFSEAYELPAKLKELGVNSDHKVALVYSPGSGAESLFTFLDDRSYNLGLRQKAFSEIEQACEWLTEVEKDDPVTSGQCTH